MAELPSVEVNLNGVGPTLPGGAFGLLFSNEVTGQFNNLVSLDLSGQCQSTGDILRVFQNLPFSALRSLSLRPAVTLEDKSQRILPLEGAVNAPPKLREFHLHFYGIGMEHSWEAAQIMSIGHHTVEISICEVALEVLRTPWSDVFGYEFVHFPNVTQIRYGEGSFFEIFFSGLQNHQVGRLFPELTSVTTGHRITRFTDGSHYNLNRSRLRQAYISRNSVYTGEADQPVQFQQIGESITTAPAH